MAIQTDIELTMAQLLKEMIKAIQNEDIELVSKIMEVYKTIQHTTIDIKT